MSDHPHQLCGGFGAKLAFEAITGGTLFTGDMGEGVVSVPVAHLAGAMTAVILSVAKDLKLRDLRIWRSFAERSG